MSEQEATHARQARGFAEVVQLIGAVLVIVGLWLITPALAYIGAGAGFLAVGTMVERGLPNGPGRIARSED